MTVWNATKSEGLKLLCLGHNMLAQIKFLKFIAVGVLNTANGYVLFSTFIYLGLHYTLASLFATILGVLFNFKTYGRFVFKSGNNKLIFRFIGVYLFTYLLGILCLKAFSLFSISMYVAGLILIIPFAIISFFLNSRFVFN